jgi:hypothetical protein
VGASLTKRTSAPSGASEAGIGALVLFLIAILFFDRGSKEGTMPQSKNSPHRASRMRTFALLASLIVLFFVAIFFLEGNSTQDRSSRDDAAGKNFSGSLTLSGLTYDRQTKSGAARAELKVQANAPDLDVNRVGFSYEENPLDHSRYFQYCHLGESCMKGFEEVPQPKGRPLTSARIHFDLIPFQAMRSVPEVFYPFDETTFQLSLMGCINDGAEACAPGNDLAFNKFKIELADPDFILDGDRTNFSERSVVFSLKRKVFLRAVSGLFLLISAVFLVYLLRLSNPNELMTKSLGFFGTLWGLRALLVPATAKVFPTSVDYAILGLFCFLFVWIVLGVKSTPTDAGG